MGFAVDKMAPTSLHAAPDLVPDSLISSTNAESDGDEPIDEDEYEDDDYELTHELKRREYSRDRCFPRNDSPRTFKAHEMAKTMLNSLLKRKSQRLVGRNECLIGCYMADRRFSDG
jgi:hypothetical protein